MVNGKYTVLKNGVPQFYGNIHECREARAEKYRSLHLAADRPPKVTDLPNGFLFQAGDTEVVLTIQEDLR